MVNQDQGRTTERILGDKLRIREIDLVLIGGIHPVGIPQGETVPRLVTEVGIWGAVIWAEETAGVVGARVCSSRDNRVPLTAWIEAVGMPEWPATGEARVARAHHHSEAEAVAAVASQVAAFPVEVVAVSPAEVVAAVAVGVEEGK